MSVVLGVSGGMIVDRTCTMLLAVRVSQPVRSKRRLSPAWAHEQRDVSARWHSTRTCSRLAPLLLFSTIKQTADIANTALYMFFAWDDGPLPLFKITRNDQVETAYMY